MTSWKSCGSCRPLIDLRGSCGCGRRTVREYLTVKTSTPDRDRSGVLPAGLVGSPGLDLARREVLGGLPSSRRGH